MTWWEPAHQFLLFVNNYLVELVHSHKIENQWELESGIRRVTVSLKGGNYFIVFLIIYLQESNIFGSLKLFSEYVVF